MHGHSCVCAVVVIVMRCAQNVSPEQAYLFGAGRSEMKTRKRLFCVISETVSMSNVAAYLGALITMLAVMAVLGSAGTGRSLLSLDTKIVVTSAALRGRDSASTGQHRYSVRDGLGESAMGWRGTSAVAIASTLASTGANRRSPYNPTVTSRRRASPTVQCRPASRG